MKKIVKKVKYLYVFLIAIFLILYYTKEKTIIIYIGIMIGALSFMLFLYIILTGFHSNKNHLANQDEKRDIMNNKQKKLSYMAVILMFSALLYPPYIITNHNHIVKEVGYNFLFALSKLNSTFAANVNIELLTIEITVIMIGFLILFFTFKTDNENDTRAKAS